MAKGTKRATGVWAAKRCVLAALLGAGFATSVVPETMAQVTFEEVLAAPDDPDINLAYVRQEVAAGRLQSAASVLERMLLTEPDWDAARLAYGIVLYRLEDNLGAIREFIKLEDRELSPRQEADRQRYLRLARNGEQALRISGSTAIGLRLDTNPSQANRPLDGASRPFGRDTDGAATSSSRLRIEYDLGGDPAVTAFFTVGNAVRSYFDTDSASIAAADAAAGVSVLNQNLQVSVFATGAFALQDYDLFRRAGGFGASFTYDMANGEQRTRLLGGVRSAYENFDDTEFTGIADERDGWLTSLNLGVRHFFTDANRVSFGAAYDRKNARDDGLSYDRVTLSAGYLALLGRGVYSDTNASWSHLSYDRPFAPQTGAATREDRTWRVRTALGSPLETIFGAIDVEVPEAIGSLVLQGGLTYTDRSSNVERYEFDNFGADILLIKRFQF